MKNLADKYSYRVDWSPEDDAHVARILEFPSLAAHGDSPEKALAELKKAVRASLRWMDEKGEEIPKPISSRAYSGKLNVRMPPDLHRELVIAAEAAGVSLNHLIVYRLSHQAAVSDVG